LQDNRQQTNKMEKEECKGILTDVKRVESSTRAYC